MFSKNMNKMLIFLAAVLIMFLPRRIYIVGIFSFRAIILGLFLIYVLRCGKIKFPRALRNILMIVYFIYSFLNYFFTFQISSGIGFLVDNVILIMLLTSLLTSREYLEYFLDTFCGMLAIYAVLGVFESLTGINFYDVIASTSAIQSVRFGLTRFCGAGLVSSNNANFLLLSSVLVMYRIINTDGKKKKCLIGVYILNALALCSTLTRASILLFVALQCVWLIKAGVLRFINRHFISVSISVLVVLILICFVPQVNEIVTNFAAMFQAIFDSATADSIGAFFGSNAQGSGERLQLYDWVSQHMVGKELFGNGANTPFIHEWTTWYGVRVTKISLENHYLMMYYQLGIVGLVTFLGHYFFMFLYTRKIERIRNKSEASLDSSSWNLANMVKWGILVMIPAMFVTALFDELRMIYLMFALVISYGNILREENLKVLGE